MLFSESRGRKIGNITKIELKRLFCLLFWFTQKIKLNYTINIWFNFVSGSFFELIYFRSLREKMT